MMSNVHFMPKNHDDLFFLSIKIVQVKKRSLQSADNLALLGWNEFYGAV